MTEVLCERPETGIAVLRLNRPEARNALSLSLRKQLAEHLNTLDENPDVRAVIVTVSPSMAKVIAMPAARATIPV